ncbi:LysR family transcriptional regulator [Longispora albida]|uniref:LysR family transcriptional regulator n=1 Tax=Longispora albida TaxID=203523 RepID=UPI000377B73D|nr:LysR family transcriptional regulator [Longispora albida]
MELRDIEIFLTLAEELHFGRTAQRLFISQARVSQAIKKQERTIGAPLFERTSRVVHLTAVGQQLRDDLRPLFAGLRDSIDRASLVARGTKPLLRIGTIAGFFAEMRPYFDTYRRRHPGWDFVIRPTPFLEPFEPLRRGDIDLMICWLPVEEPDLTTGPVLRTESRMLMVSPQHRLAGESSVSIEVLGDQPVLSAARPLPDYWENAYMPFFTPSGRPIERGTPISTLDEIHAIISTTDAIHQIFAHATVYNTRPDIVHVPIVGGSPGRWGLVWRSESENDQIRAFAAVVRELGEIPPL